MKKLFLTLSSVLAIASYSYAFYPEPEIYYNQRCKEEGVTHHNEAPQASYNTQINVPSNSSVNHRVEIYEKGRNTADRVYDTRTNAPQPSESNGKYNTYKYKGTSDTRINVECYD